MIVNIRGTSGSGKSTLVRAIMALFPHKDPIYIEGRKRPIGYQLGGGAQHNNPLFVVGSYENECGGCDTFAEDAMNTIYKLVAEKHRQGVNVLFEGLLVSAEARRLIDLHKDGFPLLVISLTTPIEECLTGVLDRRARRGSDAVLGPNTRKNMESKQKGTATCCRRFREAGIDVLELDRAAAFEAVKNTLTRTVGV